MKKAFTLAEVLIVIGVIGIVAAMTIPSLINYYKVKELEVRFKKADALITQAFLKTANEYGYDSISSFNIPGRTVTDENYAELKRQVEGLNEIWLKQFTSVDPLDYSRYKDKKCKHLSGEGTRFCFFDSAYGTPYVLPNGMLISALTANYGGTNHPGIIRMFFDTNGPEHGPNRWGYDLFLYSSNFAYNNLCDPSSKNTYAGLDCYYFAHNNINPTGNNKPYWDMLFKPLTYWQKSDK